MKNLRLGILASLFLFVLPASAFAQQSTCPDGVCDTASGEDEFTCPDDCPITGYCGDGTCDPGIGEDSDNCSQDCPAYCGNGVCDPDEDSSSCPQDCEPTSTCGDNSCDADEDEYSCPDDCGTPSYCGDYTCDADEDEWSCSEDCGTPSTCGDYTCDADEDEYSCPEDCGTPSYCGDNTCDVDEDEWSCESDCGPPPSYCGDYTCDADEDPWSCETDCGPPPGYCGDYICDTDLGEDEYSCPEDCGPPLGYCGDYICDSALGEDEYSCPDDCGYPPSEDEDGDGYTVDDGDCDDYDPAVNPGATEVCDESDVDEDCNGLADDYDSSASGKLPYWTDFDGDSYGDALATAEYFCDPASEWVSEYTDCDDTRDDVNPGAQEVCDDDFTDEDCDYLINDYDDSVTGQTTWYIDSDGDLHGVADETQYKCDQEPGWSATDDDCDDNDANRNPSALEFCDPADTDEDCDYGADNDDPDGAFGELPYWRDTDGDGFGEENSQQEDLCDAPAGWVRNDDDCNDADAAINPNAAEVCDPADVDENCNGSADSNDPTVTDATDWYDDNDNDSYGDPATLDTACERPDPDMVENGDDCDDTRAAIRPSAHERCDGEDNDCDELIDDADPDLRGAPTWGVDDDWDGWTPPSPTEDACIPPDGWVPHDGGDCDDNNPSRNPGQIEICDGFDNDCTFVADDRDLDGDAFSACFDDCDDLDPLVNPLANEECDGVDRDCDGDPGVAECLDEVGDGDVDGDFGLPLGPCAGGSVTLSAAHLLNGPVLEFDTDVVVGAAGLSVPGSLAIITPCEIRVSGPLSGQSLLLVAGERLLVKGDVSADQAVLRSADRVILGGAGWLDVGELGVEAPLVKFNGDVDGASAAAEADVITQGSNGTLAPVGALHLDAGTVSLSGQVLDTETVSVVTTGKTDLQGSSSVSGVGSVDVVAGGRFKLAGDVTATGSLMGTGATVVFPANGLLSRVDDVELDAAGNATVWRGDVEDCGFVSLSANKIRVRADASFVGNELVDLDAGALLRLEGDFVANGAVEGAGSPWRTYGAAEFTDNGSCTLAGPEHSLSVGAPACTIVP